MIGSTPLPQSIVDLFTRLGFTKPEQFVDKIFNLIHMEVLLELITELPEEEKAELEKISQHDQRAAWSFCAQHFKKEYYKEKVSVVGSRLIQQYLAGIKDTLSETDKVAIRQWIETQQINLN